MYCFSACGNVFCSSCKEVVTKEEEKETVVGTEVEEEVDVVVVTEVEGDEIETVVGTVVGTEVVQDVEVDVVDREDLPEELVVLVQVIPEFISDFSILRVSLTFSSGDENIDCDSGFDFKLSLQ